MKNNDLLKHQRQGDTLSGDLLRQRRNLITISSVILIFDFADVTIAKVSVLGTELLVGNVHALMICVWVLWAYWVLRYYQYWKIEPDKNIKKSISNRLSYHVSSYVGKNHITDNHGGYIPFHIRRKSFASWEYRPIDPVEEKTADDASVNLPMHRLLFWTLISFTHVCLQTPHATNHILPFAVALAAPVSTLISVWNGYA